MRLVVVSNRLPFTVSLREGTPHFADSPGGLTSGLGSYLHRASTRPTQPLEFLWVGWPGMSVAPRDQPAVRDYGQKTFNASPVFLPEESMEGFYQGFCNRTLWPLFHYFPSLIRYEEDYWDEYKRVNGVFMRLAPLWMEWKPGGWKG